MDADENNGSGTVPHHCSRSVCVLFLCLAGPSMALQPAGGPAIHGPFLILQATSIGPGRPLAAGFFFPGTKMVACISLSSWKLCARPCIACMHGPRKDAWRADACMAARARGDDTAHAPLPRPSTQSASCRHGPWAMALDRPIAMPMHACIATA